MNKYRKIFWLVVFLICYLSLIFDFEAVMFGILLSLFIEETKFLECEKE